MVLYEAQAEGFVFFGNESRGMFITKVLIAIPNDEFCKIEIREKTVHPCFHPSPLPVNGLLHNVHHCSRQSKLEIFF